MKLTYKVVSAPDFMQFVNGQNWINQNERQECV